MWWRPVLDVGPVVQVAAADAHVPHAPAVRLPMLTLCCQDVPVKDYENVKARAERLSTRVAPQLSMREVRAAETGGCCTAVSHAVHAGVAVSHASDWPN